MCVRYVHAEASWHWVPSLIALHLIIYGGKVSLLSHASQVLGSQQGRPALLRFTWFL